MRIRTATVAAGVLLALAGCSSGSDDKPAADPTTTAPATAPPAVTTTPAGDDKAALVTAVQAYTKAFFAQDAPGVVELLSARCRQETSVTEMQGVLTTSAAMYGQPAVKSIEVNQISGDMARVTVHYVKPPMPETPQSWTREHVWRFDGCR